MTAILLVKTSSLGDVVHNLPVVADIRRALGGDVVVDWVVEKSFAAIPALHPGVRTVLDCEIRRWRKSWMDGATRAEWRAFRQDLQARSYDAIIDTQGLLKSALIARIARGRRYGLDWRSSREPLGWFYDRVFDVARDRHAVERNRALCGLALGYTVDGPLDYGIRSPAGRPDWLPIGSYVVCLHGTSHPSKLWPEAHWVALGRRYSAAACTVVFPWGSEAEQDRSRRLAAAVHGAVVPERLDIASVARLLGGASAVVGVDTGLTHLAAALDRPVVGIYGATSPATTGVYALGRAVNVGTALRFPAVDEVIAALSQLGAAPADVSCGAPA